MKLKKIMFVLLLGIVFVAGWFFTLQVASGSYKLSEQKALVDEADTYIAKKLYVRGIPLLEQAAEIDTKERLIVERKLLEAYLSYGNMDGYYKVLRKIDSDGSAAYKDYLLLAEYEINKNHNVKHALAVVSEGMKKHTDESLKDFYEKYIYEYNVRGKSYSEIIGSKWNEYSPALMDGKWNYVNREGNEVVKTESEEAYNFNKDGYGLIKKDGVYKVILKNGDLYGIDEGNLTSVKGITGDYIIAEKDGKYGFYNYDFKLLSEKLVFDDITFNNDGMIAVKKDDKWSILKDNGDKVTDFIYEDVAVNSSKTAFESGMAVVKKDGKWDFIDVEGNVISKESFANAKAPESDGLVAVANADGKWGFADRSGKLIIDYKYEDAKSFSCKVGAVKRADKWGYVNAAGNFVIENIYDEAGVFNEGFAVVKTETGLNIINLIYYELLK